jgi:hypothetical protein
MSSRLLQATCLRPTYSLRRQLIVSNGVTAFVTILMVVVAAAIVALRAGDTVKVDARRVLTDQYIDTLQESGRLTSDLFTKRWDNIESTVELLAELVRDRIVGYPNEFADDRHVPFVDHETRERKYPLKADLLPRDWQVNSNWNEDNLEEHTQERAELSKDLIGIMSTGSSFFYFQGNCNPDHTPGQSGYHPFCDDDHNNATLGGAVNPTTTLAPLEQKAADISVFLKPLWEAEPSAMAMSVFFFNSGAGAAIQFPSFSVHSEATYQSAGCEWMNKINSFTDKPYGTKEEIARCAGNGTVVPIRLYNPMEREFCADQALHPNEVRVSGPYLDAVWSTWRLTVGKAVFDRVTGNFIGCTALDVRSDLAKEFLDSISVDNRTNLAITRLDGTVLVGRNTSFEDTVKLWNTEFITEKTYNTLLENSFWEHDFGFPEKRVEKNIVTYSGKLYSVYTSPPPPLTHDPDFVPDFLIFTSVEVEDIFAVVNDIADEIDEDVVTLIITATTFGLVGLVSLLGFVFVVAQLLTRPLTWMENVAWKIVNHSDKRVGDTLVVAQNYEKDPLTKCVPRTEATELVDEFESMIRGFSGEGPSTVASYKLSEVRNAVTWSEEFHELYNVSVSEENKEKLQMNLTAQSVSRRISRTRYSTAKFNPNDFEKIVEEEEEEDAQFRSIEMVEVDEDYKPLSMKFAINPGQSTGEPSLEIRPSSIISRRSVSRFPFADSEVVDSSLRMNPGVLIAVSANSSEEDLHDYLRISRSSLFWCILLWIVFPLLLCIIAISTVVAVRLDTTFPEWIGKARDSSFSIEFDRLISSAHLRARFAEQVIPGSMRDLHLLTRVAGWLLFGAVGRSESFTQVEMKFMEECKVYSPSEVCPYEADEFRTPCPCEWNDPWGKECQEPPADPRTLQRHFFMSQRRDYDPATGDRNASHSFPISDYSPETTSWWSDPDQLPGSAKGTEAAGYQTAYDRLRVISALSTVSFPLYNYVNNNKKKLPRTSMSSFVAFDADGSFVGYAGCNYDFSRYAGFEADSSNGAHLVNEILCPEGKFGYDPRCRSWYETSKKLALESLDGVYVTPPYEYAGRDAIGNTAVSPLVDPRSGEFVGSALIDFATTEIHGILNRSSAGIFGVVIAEGSDASNIVFSSLEKPASLVNKFLPFDDPDSTNVKRFEALVADMKAGRRESGSLTRFDKNRNSQQIFYSFSPIMYRELKPVQPDDSTRGAKASNVVLYSLVVAEEHEHLDAKFNSLREGIQDELRKANVIFLVVTTIITVVCILVTARVSSFLGRFSDDFCAEALTFCRIW